MQLRSSPTTDEPTCLMLTGHPDQGLGPAQSSSSTWVMAPRSCYADHPAEHTGPSCLLALSIPRDGTFLSCLALGISGTISHHSWGFQSNYTLPTEAIILSASTSFPRLLTQGKHSDSSLDVNPTPIIPSLGFLEGRNEGVKIDFSAR